MDCGQKNFQLVWRCHQLLSEFLAKSHLPQVSRQLRRPLIVRVTNYPRGYAQISWHVPYSWGKTQKSSARRPSVKRAVRLVIAPNKIPFLQMRSVGSHSTSGREKEGNKEWTGLLFYCLWDMGITEVVFEQMFEKYDCGLTDSRNWVLMNISNLYLQSDSGNYLLINRCFKCMFVDIGRDLYLDNTRVLTLF